MLGARLRLALVALTLCALAAVIGATLAARSDGPNPNALELSADGWAGAIRPPGQPVPDFTLTDQDGKPVTSSSLKGKPVVYAFVYSTCEDTCPAQVQTIKGAVDDLDREDVQVVGISVDPVNDNPKRAESFLLKQGMTGRMTFLLGTREELAPVWEAFAVQPQQDDLEHSAHTILADANGMQRIGFPFDHMTQEALANDLGRL
ncbi:SCO family protein [Solirubrobacter sp. CPCC 204708]|uniref:SCO family protein n=1 Tax=Solirubrobacter deserti TaxID=2282478 RepID=A0ABT4RMY6_9ACTN|nr:SCO family protein [Solirubrobacter deserti]MBE2320157.1 SCO family protein [Solirubrobacter deserti]MDA0139877.1 SCO family protein [Solirubrobacter deserti]